MPTGLVHYIDKLRNAAGSRFFQRIHHFTQRIKIEQKEVTKKNIVVFSPHADDETLGVGGTLQLFANKGSNLKIVLITSDENDSDYALVRKNEAIQLAEQLGASYEFWDFPDGKVSLFENELSQKVSHLLAHENPNIVFTPHPVEQHRDHQATAAAVSQGAKQCRFEGKMWAYEVWAPLWPNTAINISDVIARKEELIGIFQSQLKHVDYTGGILGLNKYRGLQIFSSAAESFYVSSVDEYYLLCQNLYKM